MTYIKSLTVNPTVDTSAYATGDLVSPLMTFTAIAGLSRAIKIMTALIKDKANQKLALDLVLFKANPTASTFTLNAAVAIHASDLDKVCGVVSFVAGDYEAFNANAVAHKSGLHIAVQLDGADLYGILVARSAPTYAASDLFVTVAVERPD